MKLRTGLTYFTKLDSNETKMWNEFPAKSTFINPGDYSLKYVTAKRTLQVTSTKTHLNLVISRKCHVTDGANGKMKLFIDGPGRDILLLTQGCSRKGVSYMFYTRIFYWTIQVFNVNCRREEPFLHSNCIHNKFNTHNFKTHPKKLSKYEGLTSTWIM